MKKVQVGNIYKIDTQKGFALMQLVKMPEDIRNDIELVKIGYHLFDSLPEMNDTIFREGYFFVHFPVKVALRRKIIELVDGLNDPETIEVPNYFRSPHYFKTDFWMIIDEKNDSFIEVQNLSDEQLKLSPSGMWTDLLIIERLENGWRLENWI